MPRNSLWERVKIRWNRLNYVGPNRIFWIKGPFQHRSCNNVCWCLVSQNQTWLANITQHTVQAVLICCMQECWTILDQDVGLPWTSCTRSNFSLILFYSHVCWSNDYSVWQREPLQCLYRRSFLQTSLHQGILDF